MNLTISIPYGAIKSLKITDYCLFQLRFQFLMVRLKVLANTSPICSNIISIPYGAIKSSKWVCDQMVYF